MADQDFINKKRTLGVEPAEFFRRHLSQLSKLAELLGYGDDYRVFLATDQQEMQAAFMEVAGPARGIVRKQVRL